MLNVVAAHVYDPAGYVELDVLPSNTSGPTRRRMSRIATTDGGAVFNDGGCSDADRTIELTWQSRARSEDEAVERLVRTYTRVVVVTRDGVYLAAPERFTPGPEPRLTLLVDAKLSA